VHKTTRTSAPMATTTYPDFDIDSSTIRRLTIQFYDQGNRTSKAKPSGQHGAEICLTMSDTPIVGMKNLIYSSFDTHSSVTLKFERHNLGKKARGVKTFYISILKIKNQ
jgi:hypothetical protein